MVKQVITFLRPERSLKGKLESKIKAIVWDYDEGNGQFSCPHQAYLQSEHRIPTRLARNWDIPYLQGTVEVYKGQVRTRYMSLLAKIQAEMAKINPGTKRGKELESKKETLENFLSDLDSSIRLEGPFHKGTYSAYHLVMPFLESGDQRIYLSKDFQMNNPYNRVQSMVEQQFDFPFGIIESKGGEKEDRKVTNTEVSLKHLLSAKGLAYDLETKNWQKVRLEEVRKELFNEDEDNLKKYFLELAQAYSAPFDARELELMDRRDFLRGIEQILDKNKGESITVASLINLQDNENYLVTTFDCGKGDLRVSLPRKRKDMRKVKIIRVENREQLVAKVNELYRELNPFFSYGHNQLKFDYEKPEELGEEFAGGVGEVKPLFLGQIPGGFRVLRVLPGRIDIDPSGYAQHYMHLYNNKLDTVFRHVTGISSPKTLTYGELVIKTKNAEEGSQGDAEEILYYAAQDSMKSYLIGERLKKEHLLLARVFSSLPARVDVTAKKTLAEDYWAGWYWKHKRTHPSKEIRISSITLQTDGGEATQKHENFKKSPRSAVLTEQTFEEFSWIGHMRKELEKMANLRAKKGLANGVIVSFFPFAYSFKELVARDSRVRDLYAAVEETEDFKEKSRLLLALESITEYPLFKSLDYRATETSFAAEFELGFSDKELEEYRRRTTNAIAQIVSILKENPPINVNQEVFILPHVIAKQSLEMIVRDGLGIVLGEGKFLSGTKGRFAGQVKNEPMMMGIADYTSNKGERCLFEKMFYETFIKKVVVLGDLKGATEYLAERARLLAQGKIRMEEVVYEREARRDHTDYSIRATQRYVPRMAEQQMRTGERLRYEYNLEEMQEKFFGLPTTKQQEQILKYRQERNNQMNLFGGDNDRDENETETPRARIGTLSEPVEWVFRFKPKSLGRRILGKVYSGSGTEEDITLLMNLYNSEIMINTEQRAYFQENTRENLPLLF